MEINIDFDGTCVTHDFPRIGKDIGSIPVLQELISKGHRLILFTMRSDIESAISNDPNIIGAAGDYLTQALEWFKENDIPLYGIQTNPTQHEWTTSPKSYAPLMIDDSALGCPLKFDPNLSDRPFVDWARVRELLIEMKIL